MWNMIIQWKVTSSKKRRKKKKRGTLPSIVRETVTKKNKTQVEICTVRHAQIKIAVAQKKEEVDKAKRS